MNTRRVIVIHNRKESYIMAQAGRKRRTDVERYPGGRIKMADRGERGETVEQIRATVVAQRIRMWGATIANANDQRWETPLGHMRMQAIVTGDDSQGISSRQYEAIKQYIMVRHLHRIAQGYPMEMPKSIGADMVAASTGDPMDLDDEEVFKRSRNHNGSRSALLEYAGRGVEYIRCVDALARDRYPRNGGLGITREAANILANYWGL